MISVWVRIVFTDTRLATAVKQGRHRWSLTDEHLNVAFRFGQGRRSFQWRQRTRGQALLAASYLPRRCCG